MPPKTASEMPPASWRALTASRLASFKDYVAQKDYRATYDSLSSRVRWDQRTRQTSGRSPGLTANPQRQSLGTERVQLFPGWAVRQYLELEKAEQRGAEFSLHVYVSGFASSVRPPEAATRSQRAFYRIAKSYAALPKLPTAAIAYDGSPLSEGSTRRSDVDLLLPSTSPVDDEAELAVLQTHLDTMTRPSSSSDLDGSEQDGTKNGDRFYFSQGPHSPASVSSDLPASTSTIPEQSIDDAVLKLHSNFDARLRPFWSNAIPNRLVRLSIFCPETSHAPSEAEESREEYDSEHEPVFAQNIITNRQGAFQATFSIPWERLATHPPALHVAYGGPDVEYPIVVQAELWPPSLPSRSPSRSNSAPSSPYLRTDFSQSSHVFSSPRLPSVTCRVTVPLSMPHVPVRLISDIDDTVKHTGVLLGAKHVFRNVFVRHHEELVVHSMVSWYKALWQRGVRFHYVSNSPFELLPVLNEYFSVSSLPQGSIKLKLYAARSLLPALLSPPASRKRQGVVDVLDAFEDSRFILVGDSGEQDMELYAELARERPKQIIGVFIRDVTTDPVQNFLLNTDQVSQVTNDRASTAQPRGPLVNTEPEPISMPSIGSLKDTPNSLRASATDNQLHRGPRAANSPPPPPISRSSSAPVIPTTATARFSDALPRRKTSVGTSSLERKRYELLSRIERARAEIPHHIAFRVFQDPGECLEVDNLLNVWLKN